MLNRLFGIAATAAGFAMLFFAQGNVAVLFGGIIVISVGLGFAVYGDGS